MSDGELRRAMSERAEALGFARMGVAAVEALEPEGARLRAWLSAGRHGSMAWMAEGEAVRVDPRAGYLPSAKSVVVLVTPYARAEGDVGPSPGVVARYARGRDYHNVVGRKARKLADWLRTQGHVARAGTDSMPVYERAWAQRAGVGFIGKNCCLIVPGLGSHVFLSTVVTSAVLPADAPMPERCGACTRCLDGCPTAAFAAPRELDARRCVSYLTIEHEGPIEPGLRAGIGTRIFGCDVCQDVCPFNRTAPPDPARTEAFAPDSRWATHDAAALLTLDEAAFEAWAQGSPLRRAGRAGMARNAALVLGHAGEKRHLPVLQAAAQFDADAGVRDAAAWAASELSRR
jgi:epoxyqueuosine reductase